MLTAHTTMGIMVDRGLSCVETDIYIVEFDSPQTRKIFAEVLG